MGSVWCSHITKNKHRAVAFLTMKSYARWLNYNYSTWSFNIPTRGFYCASVQLSLSEFYPQLTYLPRLSNPVLPEIRAISISKQ